MTGMTKDYAIAILRRMQEPEPFEPQINESAFDALEMAIQALSAQDTDVISRKAAIDAIHKYFGKRIEQSPMHKTVDGEVYDLGICNPLLADNKALSQALEQLPSAQPEHPKGKWIEYIPEHGQCPFCGNQVDLLGGKANNFCGECGADMRGERDG